MKKFIVFAMLLIIATAGFSQQTKSSTAFAKQDYLQKSKNRKKVAQIMLGGGATLILTGIIIPKGEIIRDNFWSPDYKNDGMKSTFYFIGTLSMLGSIPFFISSHHNKKMAASLSLKKESFSLIHNSSLVYRTVPSLSLKLKL